MFKREVSCEKCSLRPICLASAISPEQLDEIDRIVRRGRSIKRGETLFHASSPFESVYAVRSGAIKTYSLAPDGEELVTGFYLPGEILGLEGISQEEHTSTAVALETSTVCEIPFKRFGELAVKIPSLQQHFFSIMSEEIYKDRTLHRLLSKRSADERVIALLLSLSARNRRRGLSGNEFRLPMSRYDIGNYLGLAVETVSRIFTRLNKSELLEVSGRDIKIPCLATLRQSYTSEN